MGDELAARLARIRNNQTLRLTHHGRKSGKPYDVTIWFAVEGETIYLPTASVERQWPRNVIKRPDVTLRIGDQTFSGKIEPITDAAGKSHVMDLVARKYWYARPYLWAVQGLQGLGLVADRWGTFRVRLDSAAA